MIVKFEIQRFALVSDGVWSQTPEIVKEAYDVKIRLALGESKDTVSFKIPNNRGMFKNQFYPQDLVAVHYLVNGETSGDNNLIFYGLIKKVTGEFSDKGKFLRIEGVSFGEITTNALVFYDPGDNTQNVMQYLEACLHSIQLRNTNFNVAWNQQNPTVKTNGAPFPVFTSANAKVKDLDKSFASLLDKYLTTEYTGDVRYFWYVNNKRELVIRPRRTSNPVATWVEGVDYKSIKFNVDTEDVRNFIVVKCGLDNNNAQITTYYDDLVSRVKYGFRYYMIVDNNIAADLKKTGLYSNNSALRAKAKEIGLNRAKAFAAAHNKGVLQATVVIAPTTNYSIGDVVYITASSYATKDYPNGLHEYPMRVTEMQFGIDNVIVTLAEEVAIV